MAAQNKTYTVNVSAWLTIQLNRRSRSTDGLARITIERARMLIEMLQQRDSVIFMTLGETTKDGRLMIIASHVCLSVPLSVRPSICRLTAPNSRMKIGYH